MWSDLRLALAATWECTAGYRGGSWDMGATVVAEASRNGGLDRGGGGGSGQTFRFIWVKYWLPNLVAV